ncbi:MAG TPA: hypothetical protein VF699_12870 [Caulobacteraceae bacterium]
MSELVVRLTRLSNERHRFEYRRPDGSGEAVEMETRSLLTHDLAHFAVEAEAGLQDGFYGKLARAGSYAEISGMDADALGLERVVVTLQGSVKTEAPADHVWGRLVGTFSAMEEPFPEWLNPEVVERIHRRLRALLGEQRATPFGDAMELRFPLT